MQSEKQFAIPRDAGFWKRKDNHVMILVISLWAALGLVILTDGEFRARS
jgi:hypothetical protein